MKQYQLSAKESDWQKYKDILQLVGNLQVLKKFHFLENV